jgi:molybdopterin-guanine dinucleotide biosynthesis protein A
MDRLFGSAAILAGGESSRMGFDKALLANRCGRQNLELLVESLSAHFYDVFIVRRRGLFDDTPMPPGVRIVYDDMGESGPMTGIVSALANCACEFAFICACDAQPIHPAYLDLLIRLTNENTGRDAVLPRVNGYIQPFWSFYGARLLPQARAEVISKQQSPFRFIKNRDIYVVEENVITDAGVPTAMFSNRND